jgi:uncharacterized HAD superfamily protein
MKYLKYFETFTNKVVLGIDIDGTINNMVDAYNTLYKKYFPNNKIYDADISWDWYQQMDYNGADPKEWFNNHKAEIFSICQPYTGAVNTINNIYEFIKSHGFTLNIVTNQPTPEAKLAAKEWLDRNGFKYDNVVFATPSSDKWKYADIMVDDSHKVIGTKPLGKISIKIMHEWNTEVEGDFNIPNINALTINLVKQAIDKLDNNTTA